MIALKVGHDPERIIAAAQRFLSEQDQMSVLTGRIFADHLRSIIGSMTTKQIIRERQKQATEVLDGCKEEMARIGLNVDALQIQSIDDGLGYITAMSAPHNAAIQQQAQIAQAQAAQAGPLAEAPSQREVLAMRTAPPSCASRSRSPTWSSRRRRTPNASGPWPSPTRKR
ncbi:flotillin family protein [Mycobacterium lacus]|uniref:Band 7 domain-containing protein n=1 Tax=Mycobacterium lacus TaxID=169765 RepID=A0A7I7NSC7_9MYCO|nr:flotillin family protein [Mycobacterium lacus]BBX99153.1 hypothetical protein MLAC_44470 [Mycobacterium lacus]